MRRSLLFAAALSLAACATAPDPPPSSWGKANVTLLQYWTDSAECTLQAAQAPTTLAIGNLEFMRRAEGPVLSEINRQQSIEETSGSVNDSLMRARQNRLQQMRAEDAARQAVITQCLSARGYRQFQLSAAQAAELRRYPEGSRERREYLHRLGSDPDVLNAQAI